MSAEEDVEAALARVTAAMPDGEYRPGQIEMARAVARAIELEEHLVVQAGTGTGKTLAYLTAAAVLRVRCVVVTTTNHETHMISPCPRRRSTFPAAV